MYFSLVHELDCYYNKSQLVGAYFNKDIHNTGRAIGINFKRRLTFSELRNMPNSDSLDLTVSADNFKNDDLFAQFEKVVAVNKNKNKKTKKNKNKKTKKKNEH